MDPHIYRVFWETSDLLITNDDIINFFREAVARQGYQVGDFDITEKIQEGEGRLEVYRELTIGKVFTWNGVIGTIEEEIRK